MLVLSRKVGEKVIVGDLITITLVSIEPNRVRIGIDAPQGVRIDREEVHRIRREREVKDGRWKTKDDT